MRGLILTVVLAFLATSVFAAAEWQENGAKVNRSEALNFQNGPDVSGNGRTTDVDFSTMTGDMNLVGSIEVDGGIYVDGSLYNATIVVGSETANAGVKFLGVTTVDPCPGAGTYAFFFNGTTGSPCFCNKLGVDLSLYNGTTACF